MCARCGTSGSRRSPIRRPFCSRSPSISPAISRRRRKTEGALSANVGYPLERALAEATPEEAFERTSASRRASPRRSRRCRRAAARLLPRWALRGIRARRDRAPARHLATRMARKHMAARPARAAARRWIENFARGDVPFLRLFARRLDATSEPAPARPSHAGWARMTTKRGTHDAAREAAIDWWVRQPRRPAGAAERGGVRGLARARSRPCRRLRPTSPDMVRHVRRACARRRRPRRAPSRRAVRLAAAALAAARRWRCSSASTISLFWLRADRSTGRRRDAPVTLEDGSRVELDARSAIALRFRRRRAASGAARAARPGSRWRPTRAPLRRRGGGRDRHRARHRLRRRARQRRGRARHRRASTASRWRAAAARCRRGRGQQSAFARRRGRGGAGAASMSTRATAWRRGKLIFEDRPLGEVLARARPPSPRLRLLPATRRLARAASPACSAPAIRSRALREIETSLGLRATLLTDYLIVLHRMSAPPTKFFCDAEFRFRPPTRVGVGRGRMRPRQSKGRRNGERIASAEQGSAMSSTVAATAFGASHRGRRSRRRRRRRSRRRSAAASMHALRIPAGSLAAALNGFADKNGLHVLYDARRHARLRTAGPRRLLFACARASTVCSTARASPIASPRRRERVDRAGAGRSRCARATPARRRCRRSMSARRTSETRDGRSGAGAPGAGRSAYRLQRRQRADDAEDRHAAAEDADRRAGGDAPDDGRSAGDQRRRRAPHQCQRRHARRRISSRCSKFAASTTSATSIRTA